MCRKINSRCKICLYYLLVIELFFAIYALISLVFLPDENKLLAKKNVDFALDLFAKISETNPNETLIFSPLAIQICLAVMFVGSTGPTADELFNSLKLISNDRQKVGSYFQDILYAYKSSALLKITNKMYILQEYDIRDDFTTILSKTFKTDVEQIDFLDIFESITSINNWFSYETNGIIKNIIQEDDINDWTGGILLNSVFFKGDWQYPFEKESTAVENFWINKSSSVKVNMMNQSGWFPYATLDNLNAIALELPYKMGIKNIGAHLSMLLLLPESKYDGLDELEQKLKTVDFWSILKQMRSRDILLKMPKFKIESDLKLTTVLQKMGIHTMFTENANMSKLLDNPDLFLISNVVHKSWMQINEHETLPPYLKNNENGNSMWRQRQHYRIPFYLNRPFLYFIVDTRRHLIFLIGKVIQLPNIPFYQLYFE